MRSTSGWLADGEARPAVLRRPGDLAREIGRSGRSSAGAPSTEEGRTNNGSHSGWPNGFANMEADRDALVILMSLASLTPRLLLSLARAEGTAVACLEAVRRGEAASVADQDRARSLDARDIWAALDRARGRLVVSGDPEYPAPLLDLPDPPAAPATDRA